MRVLVTRPQPADARLAAVLRRAGHEVDQCPALVLRGVEPSASAVAAIHAADMCVFVSVHAVRFAWPLLWARLPGGCRYFAVGPATAAALDALGLRDDQPPQAASAEQLLRLPGLREVRGLRVLVVRGRGGLPLLPDTLAARGAQVEVFEAYERLPLAKADLQLCWGPPDCIAVSSGEALLALMSAADALGLAARKVPMLVPSKRVAALGHEVGITRVIVCAGAGDAAVVAALEQLSG